MSKLMMLRSLEA